MIKATTKHILHISYYIGLVLIASIAVAWIWLAQAERELKDFPVWMREILLPSDSGYMLDADNVSLKMAGFSGLLEIHMTEARFLKNKEEVFLSFPEIIAAWDVKHLLLGRVVMDYVLLKKPEIWVGRDEGGHISLSSNDEDTESAWPLVAAWLGDEKASFSLPQVRRLFLREASLTFKDERTSSIWQAPMADIEIERDRFGHVTANMMTKIETSIGDKKLPASDFSVKMLYKASSRKLDGEFDLSEIKPESLAELVPSLAVIKGLDIKLGVKAAFSKDFNNENSGELKISLNGENGKISLPEYLPQAQKIEKLTATVEINGDANQIQLSDFEIKTDDLKIVGAANASNNGDIFNIKAEASISDMAVDQLKNYWKPDLFPEGRQWVMTHISGGSVPDATAYLEANINKQSGEFLLVDSKAEVTVKGARVAYYEDLTAVDDVDGVLTLKPNHLSIDMQAGHIGDMHLKHGDLSLPDMTAYETWLEINLEVAGAAVDAARYMQNPMFSVFMRPVNIKPEGTSGSADAKIYFKVPIGGPEKDPREFQYDISVDLKDGAAQAVMGTMEVSNANLAMHVNNDELKLKGDMKLFGKAASIDLIDRYKKAGVQDTDYNLDMITDITSLKKIGIVLPEIFNGNFKMKSKVRMDGKAESAIHDLDLTDSEIDIGYFSYKKPVGKFGSMHLETRNSAGSSLIDVHKFEISADDLKASGSLKIDVRKGELDELKMPSARFGKNDVNVEFSRTRSEDSTSIKASVSGKSLDIENLYGQEQVFGGHQSWPYVDASIDVGRLVFGTGRELKNVKGHLKCNPGECTDGKLNADYASADGGLDYMVGYENTIRKLNIKTANMGELARVLDISDNIVGGDMDITGVFNDDQDGQPLKGLLKCGKYSTVHAPVLAKLLNLASFSGVGELLEGKGIGFDKMTLPFTMKDGVINIRDGKTSGGSLGVTIGGNIDTNSKHLKLDGTMVPSYGLNSLPSSIPIIGDILVGGEGGGIFGVNYSVTGPYSDPKVSVNPLSLLTPGFLRGIFGGAETEPEPVPAN